MLFPLVLLACGRAPEVGPEQAANRGADAPAVYGEYCGGCHLPPDPASYTAGEWPAVVARMQQRRLAKGHAVIPGQTTQVIIDYLRHHAADVAR